MLLENRYILLNVIGDGTQATVYKVFDERTGCIRAYKKYKSHDTMKDAYAREKSWLQQNWSSIIPCLVDVINSGEELGFVMEWIEGESLDKWLDGKNKWNRNRLATAYLSAMINLMLTFQKSGMTDMHIVDVKPEHIIIDCTNQIHMIDFGLCSIDKAENWIGHGPSAFTDPNTHSIKKHSFQSDLYAIASVALYILHAGNPDEVNMECGQWMVGLPNWMIHLLLTMRQNDITYRYRNYEQFLSDWNKKRLLD